MPLYSAVACVFLQNPLLGESLIIFGISGASQVRSHPQKKVHTNNMYLHRGLCLQRVSAAYSGRGTIISDE